MSSEEIILRVDNLRVHFPIQRGWLRRQVGSIKAVDGLTFDVRRGETLGLVGESGCGKTTTGRAIVRLEQPSSGFMAFEGEELANLSGQQLRDYRQRVQMIFQDPFGSLNPRMRVESIVGEPLLIHKMAQGSERTKRVKDLLDIVGLNPSHLRRYPHEFSGGQRQRIGIARALASSPSFIICDEPISALDVSIQAQIVNLLGDLQSQLKLTYLFIAHDLSMVRHISDRVAVMYLGQIMELAECDQLYEHPMHPYTIALLSTVPVPDPVFERQRKQFVLEGDVPSPANPPAGCPFSTRCPIAVDRCTSERPALRLIGPGHQVACHLVDETGLSVSLDPSE